MNEKPGVAKVSLHKLKPCPFCGAEPVIEIEGGVTSPWIFTLHCPKCGVRMRKESITGATIAIGKVGGEVAEAWNKRATADESSKDKWALPDNLKWLLPLLLCPPMPPRDTAFSATNGSKSVNLHFDPHDPESVKAAEVWVNAIFGDKQPAPTFAPTVKAVRVGDTVKSAEPPKAALDDLRAAAEPLRDYLNRHGDPHTSVIVTQDGATVKQDERGVKFRDDELLKRVKNAPLTADGTTATQPEPEPDVLEFDRLRDELVDPLPFDVIGLWGKVAEEFLKAHEQARAAWKEGKRARIKHSMIDALESLSKRLSADLEKAIGAKPEPAKPDKNGGEMTAAEHLKFVCDGLKAEPRRNIMDIAGSAFELRNLAKPLLAYLDKYGCDEYTGVTVTRDAVIVGKTPHTDAFLFEAKFPKSENPVSLKHGTWQETLLRILDTHMARSNSLNVPLQMALPSEVVVSLRNWLLGNAT